VSGGNLDADFRRLATGEARDRCVNTYRLANVLERLDFGGTARDAARQADHAGEAAESRAMNRDDVTAWRIHIHGNPRYRAPASLAP
jgi:hypothetical protein